eukprot:scaffold141543_cov42-Prasinocladus_malaysianus.AAC.1
MPMPKLFSDDGLKMTNLQCRHGAMSALLARGLETMAGSLQAVGAGGRIIFWGLRLDHHSQWELKTKAYLVRLFVEMTRQIWTI